MYRNKQVKWSILLILTAFLVSACAGMTAKQRYVMAYGLHTRIMGDYLDEYDLQSPETQARWKANVDPIVKRLDDAMNAWDTAVRDNMEPAGKRAMYMAIKNQLFELFREYGVKVEE